MPLFAEAGPSVPSTDGNDDGSIWHAKRETLKEDQRTQRGPLPNRQCRFGSLQSRQPVESDWFLLSLAGKGQEQEGVGSASVIGADHVWKLTTRRLRELGSAQAGKEVQVMKPMKDESLSPHTGPCDARHWECHSRKPKSPSRRKRKAPSTRSPWWFYDIALHQLRASFG